MALKQSLEKSINEQINAELYSAYLYMSMAAYFHTLNLKGFANWMDVQAREEFVHAKMFYNYIVDRAGVVQLKMIDAPPVKWDSPQHVFEDAYKHEQFVTDRINKLADLAMSEKDHATLAMLQWFITEQVEEEANSSGVLEQIKLSGKDGSGIFLIDKELAARVFTLPAGFAL